MHRPKRHSPVPSPGSTPTPSKVSFYNYAHGEAFANSPGPETQPVTYRTEPMSNAECTWFEPALRFQPARTSPAPITTRGRRGRRERCKRSTAMEHRRGFAPRDLDADDLARARANRRVIAPDDGRASPCRDLAKKSDEKERTTVEHSSSAPTTWT